MSRAQARKPYVISKQRERWSDHEHSRFLEALKLYGRAWRRIEGALCDVLFRPSLVSFCTGAAGG